MAVFLSAFFSVITVSGLAFLPPSQVHDGIYAVKAGGEGVREKDSGGREVILGDRLTAVWKGASIQSIGNDNTHYRVSLRKIGALETDRIVLVIDGICMENTGSSGNGDDKSTHDRYFALTGEEKARRVAKGLGVELVLRRNPCLCIEVHLIPNKETYEVGEAVTLKMEMRNSGSQAFSFQDGGKQRGRRNNQFRFIAQHSYGQGKAVPDEGDPTNFGGLFTIRTLKSGETFTKTVELDKWFAFMDPDVYRITGVFELAIYRGQFNSVHRLEGPIWADLATGECLIRVVDKKK